MSPRFPLVSGVEMIKVLKKIGYDQVRQRGSHIRLAHPDKKPVTVPNHKELGIGLTLKILKDASLTLEDYIELLKD